MKVIIKFLFTFTFSFIVGVGIIYGIVYMLRDKPLPFQSKIKEMMSKEAVVDSSLITGIPTAEQLRAQDYEKRKIKLDELESNIKTEEQKVVFQKDSLNSVKQQLDMLIGQKQGIQSERIKKLAKVYEGMRPEDAAPIISQLDDQTIVEIFLQMEDRRVARIIGLMPVDRATEITQRLSGKLY